MNTLILMEFKIKSLIYFSDVSIKLKSDINDISIRLNILPKRTYNPLILLIKYFNPVLKFVFESK